MMTEYTIQAGQSNFRPGESVWPTFSTSMEIRVVFHHSCYWSIDDWEGDRDIYDWNKLQGLSYYFSANNHTAAQFAWRPHPEKKNVIQVVPYTNYPGTSWQVDEKNAIDVPTREYGTEAPAVLRVRIYTSSVAYILRYGDVEKRAYVSNWKRPWWPMWRRVGTWIGGANNAPGPYGGKAHKDMKMWMDVI